MAAVTRLGLYGGPRGLYGDFSTKEPGTPVVPDRAGGGRSRRRARYVVEVDGQFIQVADIHAAEASLQQVRDLANISAAKDVTTEIAPKPPRIAVKTLSGNVTTSIVLQREVKKTQRIVNQAYIKRANEIAQDIEISTLILAKIKKQDADDESAIIALLLM